MQGMLIARVHLLFSFMDHETAEQGETVQCTLVSWFLPTSNQHDSETGMWMVKPEGTQRCRPVQVIPLKSITRGAHLLPKYSTSHSPTSTARYRVRRARSTRYRLVFPSSPSKTELTELGKLGKPQKNQSVSLGFHLVLLTF